MVTKATKATKKKTTSSTTKIAKPRGKKREVVGPYKIGSVYSYDGLNGQFVSQITDIKLTGKSVVDAVDLTILYATANEKARDRGLEGLKTGMVVKSVSTSILDVLMTRMPDEEKVNKDESKVPETSADVKKGEELVQSTSA